MQRSRLKNIINKSKELNKPVGSAFDQFKKSLPKELQIGDDYRLEVAWKLYGQPRDYKHALWEGLIQPISETDFKLPSIGYNEETDEYEYLNKGEDNETVAKDIRVWDNDVIPLVQELKLGGYVRKFNKEKDCWTYTKNIQKENTLDQKGSSVGQEPDQQSIEFLRLGGKKEESELIIPSFLTLDENGNYVSKYYSDDDQAEDIKWYRSKDSKAFRKQFRLNDLDWEDGTPDGKPFTYIPKKKYKELLYERYKNGFGGGGGQPDEYYDPNGEFAHGQPVRKVGIDQNGNIVYKDAAGGEWINPATELQKFKQGGQMSVIPEGALHARKNNMEGAGEDFTHKGIPVVDNKGEQQAEIERNEIIFRKEVTDKMEELYKKFNNAKSDSEKNKIAIEMGKILTCEIIKHTDDKTGLIQEIQEKM